MNNANQSIQDAFTLMYQKGWSYKGIRNGRYVFETVNCIRNRKQLEKHRSNNIQDAVSKLPELEVMKNVEII